MCCAYVYDEYITSIMRARCAEDTLLSTNGAQTKRPKIKRPKGQNVSRDKTSQEQNVPGTQRPKGQNVPRDKMSYSNYQVFKNKFCVRKLATYVR